MEPLLEEDLLTIKQTKPVVSVVVPTRNEAGNIEALLSRIGQATSEIPIEVIFVDDSTDETPQVIKKLQDQYSFDIVLIARPPERRTNGLGGAVVEGFRNARAPLACVMDGDLQHPPELIPELLKKAQETSADVVVGSRLARGGDASSLGFRRLFVSYAFAGLSRATFPMRLGRVSDPLSGLFLVRLAKINLDALRPDGFKILLEILTRFPALSVSEIPIHFEHRNAGESKASVKEVWKFLRLLFRLRVGGDPHFFQFVMVGASGILVNSAVLAFATEWLRIYYLLSIGLATVGSTIWNFSLTEFWVYRDRQQAPGRGSRFVVFFVMNASALALRGPIVFALTSRMGMHYLVSNFLSLAALTILRFFFADQWIWNTTKLTVTSMKTFNYNIHNILTVVSDAVLPELEPFLTQTQISNPSIRVNLGKSPFSQKPYSTESDQNVRRIFYDEGFGKLGFKAQIEIGSFVDVWASPFLKWSPHVLYTNVVEPILRWTFVEKGYALVHGACLDFGGRSYLITARTDTGKTTSILKVLSRQLRSTDQGAFVSDDMTLISETGRVLTYPKPMTISHHTVAAIHSECLSFVERLTLRVQSRIHSKSGRKIAHTMDKSKLPMATINAFVQFLVPPPKYYVQKLIPRVKLAKEGKLSGMFVIERFDKTEEVPLDPAEALEILFTNCEDAYGFPPYDAIKDFLSLPNGRDLRVDEHKIIEKALNGLPEVLLRSESMDWWQKIPTLIDKNMSEDFKKTVPATSNLRTLPRLWPLGSGVNRRQKQLETPFRRRATDLGIEANTMVNSNMSG